MTEITLEQVLEHALSKSVKLDVEMKAWQMLVNYYDLIYESASELGYSLKSGAWINGSYVRNYIKKATGRENPGKLIGNLRTSKIIKSRGEKETLEFYLPIKEEVDSLVNLSMDESLNAKVTGTSSFSPCEQASYLLGLYKESKKVEDEVAYSDILAYASQKLLEEISGSLNPYGTLIALMLNKGETAESAERILGSIEKSNSEEEKPFEEVYGEYILCTLAGKYFTEESIKKAFFDESSYYKEKDVRDSILYQGILVEMLTKLKVDLRETFGFDEVKHYVPGNYLIAESFQGFVTSYEDRSTNRLLTILKMPARLLSENKYAELICDIDLRV